MIKKGTWVSVRRTVLEPEERTGRLPPDTQQTPFVIWVRGTLVADAEIGAAASIQTRAGRTEHGVLEAAEPAWPLDYGRFVPELLQIGDEARAILFAPEKKIGKPPGATPGAKGGRRR